MTTITRFVTCLALLAVVPPGTHAATMSGQVTNELGEPVALVDLDFTLAATGDDVIPDSDTTDVAGQYVSIIAAGVYDVYFTPPEGSRLAGHVERDVNLNVDQSVNVTLKQAWIVSGTVTRGDDGLPAVGIDLDFEDLATGEKIFTPRDNTDVAGAYGVAVPAGIYEVTFDGPEPDLPTDPPQLAHGVIEEFSVDGSGDQELAPITLPLGYLVEGQVLDFIGIPVAGADLDFLRPGTGDKIFTKQDNTDASGDYGTIVPAGTYDIEINPPAQLSLISIRRFGVVVATDMIVGTDFLTQGPAVSGFVTDPHGSPIRGVDLDFATTLSGAPVPTAEDDTDATGHYLVRVSSGVYDINYNPLTNKQIEEVTQSAVTVSSDIQLPDVILPFHDADLDGAMDVDDGCPFTPDAAQLDQDLDGVGDLCDNCPLVSNPRQEDNDVDRKGDLCDADDDNDGLLDAADPDPDGDGIPTATDNCPMAYNPHQTDGDADANGDACDPDDGIVEYLEARSAAGLAWRPETGASGYNVYRQRLAWLSLVNYGKCSHEAAGGTSMADYEQPIPGAGFIYLATADVAGGEGSLGTSSTGDERPNLRACP